MENYYETVLSAEQMAAYLDGTLSTNENIMVEEVINMTPELAEIQDVIDTVDYTYLYETDEEIPIDCWADDFSLPDIVTDDISDTEDYKADEYSEIEYDAENNDDLDDMYTSDDSDGFDDISF